MLSLAEVRVAVIYCVRKDGLKFSVRSEREEVNAGELVRHALEGVGSGGGHAGMAGGMIPAANLSLLSQYPDNFIRKRFLDVIDPNE